MKLTRKQFDAFNTAVTQYNQLKRDSSTLRYLEDYSYNTDFSSDYIKKTLDTIYKSNILDDPHSEISRQLSIIDRKLTAEEKNFMQLKTREFNTFDDLVKTYNDAKKQSDPALRELELKNIYLADSYEIPGEERALIVYIIDPKMTLEIANALDIIDQFNNRQKKTYEKMLVPDYYSNGYDSLRLKVNNVVRKIKYDKFKYGFAALGTVVLAGLGYFAFLNKDSFKPMAISTWNAFSSFFAKNWSKLSAAYSTFAHAHPVMTNRAEGFVAGVAVTSIAANRRRIYTNVLNFSNGCYETAKSAINKMGLGK